jgi:hypothetical protein
MSILLVNRAHQHQLCILLRHSSARNAPPEIQHSTSTLHAVHTVRQLHTLKAVHYCLPPLLRLCSTHSRTIWCQIITTVNWGGNRTPQAKSKQVMQLHPDIVRVSHAKRQGLSVNGKIISGTLAF